MTSNNSDRSKPALYFHQDGFDPIQKELNGRRVAGASFLRAFLNHAELSGVNVLADSPAQSSQFDKMARSLGFQQEITALSSRSSGLPGDATILQLPGPVLTKWAWRRGQQAHHDYALCGVTHTTATSRIMNGLIEMRLAPVQEWDGVIATSHSVKTSLNWLLDEADEYIKERFGNVILPPRFQMPVIPLGIHCHDFQRSDASRGKWRKALGVENDACLIMTMSRLNSFAKFDPLPMFQALEIAAKNASVPIHFVAVGPYSDQPTTRVFQNGAAKLAPSIYFHHVDGTKVSDANGIWSAADIFTHPVDNIQETFGLAPVEAMAAGLPVVVSDWDGFKDTIPSEAGFRIKTIGPKPGSMQHEGLLYYLESDSYAQYLAQTSFQTVVDVAKLAEAYRLLINDSDLRKSMGAAGLAHVKANLDWSKVMPLYQDFWDEQTAIRKSSKSTYRKVAAKPFGADPSSMFESYPTKTANFEGYRFFAKDRKFERGHLEDFVSLREIAALKRFTLKVETIAGILELISEKQTISYCDLIKIYSSNTIDRALLWLLKYNFIGSERDL